MNQPWRDLCGAVRVGEGSASHTASSLLNGMMAPLASMIRQYFDRTADHAFAYHESQLHSVLLPALRDVAGAVFREHPVHRGTRPERNREDGWVDYWLEHNDKTVLIEVKHDFLSVRTGSLRGTTRERWREVQGQMRTLVDVGGPELADHGERAHVIGLLVLVHYGKGDLRRPDPERQDACWERHVAAKRELDADPALPVTWDALWTVPHDMQLAEWSDRTETYPAVSFFAATAKSERG